MTHREREVLLARRPVAVSREERNIRGKCHHALLSACRTEDREEREVRRMTVSWLTEACAFIPTRPGGVRGRGGISHTYGFGTLKIPALLWGVAAATAGILAAVCTIVAGYV